MKIKDVMKNLNFKEIIAMRIPKRKDIDEYYLFKIENKIYITECFLMRRFVLKEDWNVLNVPFEVWLDFYEAGAINDNVINEIIKIFVKNQVIEKISTIPNWKYSLIKKAGNYLVCFESYPNGTYKIYVMKIKED